MPVDPAEFRHIESPAVRFTQDEAGLGKLEVASALATAFIFVQGAHLTEWTYGGGEPLLFVSSQSYFAPGKAIRGGVPVCFPWFAARTGHSGSPSHGFLRTADWKVDSVKEGPNGVVTVEFSIAASQSTRELWPHQFCARYSLSIGRYLELNFEVENTGGAPFTFEEALHTYFRVSDIRSVSVLGLEGAEYIDKVAGGTRKRQGSEPLRFSGETDRVFVNTTSTCELEDPGLHRRISVAKAGSATTVVWNPWAAKAAALADFGDSEWQGMLCIETANVGENAVTLASGETHCMTATIDVG